MPRQSWMIQVFLVGFLWIFPVSTGRYCNTNPCSQQTNELTKCWNSGSRAYIVVDSFYGIINASKHFTAKLEGKNGPVLEVLPDLIGDVLTSLNETSTTGFPGVVTQIYQLVKNMTNNGKSTGAVAKYLPSHLKGRFADPGFLNSQNLGTAQRQQVVTVLYEAVPGLLKLFKNKTIWESDKDESVESIFGKVPDLLKQFLNTSSGNSGLDSLPTHVSTLLKLFINTSIVDNAPNDCMIFLQKNETRQKPLWKKWPQVKNLSLYIPKDLTYKNVFISALSGKNCLNSTNSCVHGEISTITVCKRTPGYNENSCKDKDYNDKYIINITSISCVNCDSPVKKPDETIKMNNTFHSEGEVDASKAVELMSGMEDLISKMNGTSAELSVGKGIEGVIVRKTDPADLDEVSFAYMNANDKLNIVEDAKTLETFSRSVSISKEAFEKAVSSNISIAFAAVLRFMNMSQDENNSTVLNNEVVAIEMGADIKNLTDTININFRKFDIDKFHPNCTSWNGKGSKPNWTFEGCETILNGNDIKCKCSHLTFFAVLLTPINETISSYDLNTLTIITQVGCGLSIFFLGIVLVMYFLIRKTKASTATQILIHLICALFLLNLTFLVNHFVASLHSPVGCEVMAAVMHYSMLATFSWFAAQGFHLCLQLYKGGYITIRHYVLKLCVVSWTLPLIMVITVGSLRKYGEQTIYTDNPQNNVAMCWITDNNIHYIVNVGYYSLVFLFTFTTVIITLSWLFCLKRTKAANPQESRSGRSIVIIMGLCFQLGVTWGFAFFAYGSFRMPATYIFTILNSFQGFFLFIYYYKTTRVDPNAANVKGNGNSESISTLKTGLESVVNPYMSFEKEKGM